MFNEDFITKLNDARFDEKNENSFNIVYHSGYDDYSS